MLGSVLFALFMVLPGMLIGGFGMSVVMDPMTTAALSTDSRFPLQFVHGFQHAPRAGGAIALVGCVLSAVLVRTEREATALARESSSVGSPCDG